MELLKMKQPKTNNHKQGDFQAISLVELNPQLKMKLLVMISNFQDRNLEEMQIILHSILNANKKKKM